jgi:flagellar hook-associated protein 3 FlgL
MRQRLDSVLALANASDQNGHYMFSGYSESTLPFAPGPGGVSYNGDEGQRHLQLSDERLVATNDAGSEVFQRIPNGNGTFLVRAAPSNTGAGVLGPASATDPSAFVPDTYAINFLSPADYEIRDSGGGLVASGTYADGQAIAFLGVEVVLTGVPAAGDSFSVAPSSSQDVFATLQAFIDALERPVTDQASRSLLHNDMGQGLVDIDQAVSHMIDVRAEIGARIRAIEQEAALIDGFSLQLTESLSELRDLDYAEALSLLTSQLFGLEAAQQTFARTQGLSLFRYL